MSNKEISILEDNNRKGLTRGKAIFGDKQDWAKDLTPAGQTELGHFDEGAEKSNEELKVPAHIAQLAVEEAAARGDWSQDRIDRALSGSR